MSNIEKTLQDIIQNDELHFNVDPSSIHRLKNHMRLTSLRSTVRMNSFLPLMNLKNIRPLSGIKVGFACLIIIAFFGYQHLNTNSGSFFEIDSTNSIQTADTNNIYQHNDSIYTNL